jgi:hypothetical protein
MNLQKIGTLWPRFLLFAVMLALIIYAVHFILPSPTPAETEEIALNPALQVGLFLMLTLFGALIGFWITFGDLINRTEK